MRRSILLAASLAATANFFWAANAIVGKAVVAELPAFTLSQFRWWFAFLIIAPWGIPKIIRDWSWYRSQLPKLLLLSLLSVTFYNTFQYWSLEHIQPVKVGAMLALMPLAISIVSGFFGGRKQSLLEWVTSLIAVCGALLVVTDGDLLQLVRGADGGKGELLMILAITSWAFYSVLLKQTSPNQVNIIGLLTFFVATGSLMITPFWLYDMATENVWLPSGTQWWSVLFVAVFPSIVSYFCWTKAVHLADATVAGLMVTMAPLFNALLSMAFLNAYVSALQWVGISVVMSGVVATLMISKRKTNSL